MHYWIVELLKELDDLVPPHDAGTHLIHLVQTTERPRLALSLMVESDEPPTFFLDDRDFLKSPKTLAAEIQRMFLDIEDPTMKLIDSFSGDYAFLSNFYMHTLEFDGVKYKTAEHAYQVQKIPKGRVFLCYRERLMSIERPGEVKRLARTFPLRENWDQIKISVMRRILEAKFSDRRLRKQLLETGDAKLVEGNWWGDTFWGVCNGKGSNILGKLLMDLRESLRE